MGDYMGTTNVNYYFEDEKDGVHYNTRRYIFICCLDTW